ncbi:hypothetical protein [Silvibacterium sp.]|uniref:hypothetical protein n=1 Tax=Silvibacterium sp. TaxID=1964179 RepID=UPI0039E596F5
MAVGLFNSIMFPTIFTLAVAELGPFTGRGSVLVVQAFVGGAVFPVMMGHLADKYGIHRALFLPFVRYLYVIYTVCAVTGSPLRKHRAISSPPIGGGRSE